MDQPNSRRKFLGAVAAGAAVSAIPVITGDLHAKAIIPNSEKLHEADEWFKKVKGTHRVAYDGSTPHDGFAIIWTWAFYYTNNQTNTPDDDMTAVCVLRHSGIPFAMKDSLWEKYNLGAVFGVNDKATNAPSLRNPYYEPKEGDFPLPGIDGIKRMIERGAMFCVCNLAMTVYSSVVAQNMGLNADDVYKEWVDSVLPGIQIVPSGVWALGRAQEHNCGYIFAGG